LGHVAGVPPAEIPVWNIGIQAHLLTFPQIGVAVIVGVGGEDFFGKVLITMAQALEKDSEDRRNQAEVKFIQDRLKSLTPREYEVFTLITTDLLNKQVAYELGTAEKTIKVHRARIMEKMHCESLAQLVRLAEKAGIR
jgi:FixJ family two-component response regulator